MAIQYTRQGQYSSKTRQYNRPYKTIQAKHDKKSAFNGHSKRQGQHLRVRVRVRVGVRVKVRVRLPLENRPERRPFACKSMQKTKTNTWLVNDGDAKG